MNADGSVDFAALTMGLVGGLAIFLFGMEMMTDALKLAAGSRLKGVLARMTTNRFKAVFAGAFITAIIQSSSVTTVLVVGFISAGLLSLSQSIGIIMGASIGTTVTAQIVAFKVTKYALLLVAAGFGMSFIGRARGVHVWGKVLLGLGLIFFGMSVMKDATNPLRDYAPFIEAMQNMDSPLLAVLFSAAFTAIVQSSSATTGVIIVLATQGFVSLDAGIALVFGANIGTCVTAGLAAIGKPREAVRAAMVHTLFNTAGVLLWLGFIPQLAELIQRLSPVAEGLSGVAKLRAETPRQIANAHTIFNVANTFIFIWFTPVIARIVERVLPDKTMAEDALARKGYMDDIIVHTPALALDMVRMELGRLGACVLSMLRTALDPVVTGTDEELALLRERDEEVDALHGAVITYLGRLSLEDLSEEQSHRLSEYISGANYLENIGDMIETNLVDAGRARLSQGIEISPQTRDALQLFHTRVVWAVERSVQALAGEDVDAAREVRKAKSEMVLLSETVEAHLAQRLAANEPNRVGLFRLESDLIEALKRIYYFSKRIARLVTEETPLYDRGGPDRPRRERDEP